MRKQYLLNHQPTDCVLPHRLSRWFEPKGESCDMHFTKVNREMKYIKGHGQKVNHIIIDRASPIACTINIHPDWGIAIRL